MTTLENPLAVRRLVASVYLMSILNVLALGVLFWVFDRPVAAAWHLVLLAAYAGGLLVAVQAPRTRLASMLIAWVNLGVQLLVHVSMGGYGYSGGYLLFGVVVVVITALGHSRTLVASLTVSYAVVAVILAALEGRLRQSHPAPALTLPTVVIVDVFLVSLLLLGPIITIMVVRIRSEQARNRELMLNILPQTIADRLKTQPGMIADRYEGCTIVFADLVGFTAHSKGKDPAHLVGELNTIFTRFDTLATQHGAEKIKTIGDGYMAATGLPDPDPDHVEHACGLALAMVEAMPALNAELGTDFALRVGVNTGSAVAGVVGTSKFSYDVWGDTVNLASRLESNGSPGVVVVSAAVVNALDGRYEVAPMAVKDLKGQGPTETYRLVPRIPATA